MSLTSIIIPVKNAAPWIGETLDSILAQDWQDWEVICVDDFSDDESNIAISPYCDIDSRINLISSTKPGLINALQTAFSKAKGEFITRMDADDIMPPGRLKRMVETLSNTPAKSIVTGKVKYFSEGPLSEGFLRYEKWMNERISRNDFYTSIYRECTVASPNWITRKADLDEANIFAQLQYPEDYDLLFRWFENDFKIIGIEEVTLEWRDHPTRTSKNSETYNQRSLFELKINWFKKLHADSKRIAILGAGTKGKLAVEFLSDRKLSWYDLNHADYKSEVMNHKIQDYEDINEDYLLIAIYPNNRTKLEQFIERKGYRIGQNAWYL